MPQYPVSIRASLLRVVLRSGGIATYLWPISVSLASDLQGRSLDPGLPPGGTACGKAPRPDGCPAQAGRFSKS